MLKILLERMQQKHRTSAYPEEAPQLPDRFRGAPRLDATKCPDDCSACIDACPTDAISTAAGDLRLDLGRCLFCTDCTSACPEGAIAFTRDHRLAVRTRGGLIVKEQLE